MGIILENTVLRGLVHLWYTCLSMGTLTRGTRTKDRVWPDLQSHEVWSAVFWSLALSFSKELFHHWEFTPLSHSPHICTVIHQIFVLWHISCCHVFQKFCHQFTLQARLGLEFNWIFSFHMHYIREKRQKEMLTIQLSESKWDTFVWTWDIYPE